MPKTPTTKAAKAAWDKLVAKARETVVAISENVDILVHGTGSKTVGGALAFIEANPEYKQHVADVFGVDYVVISFLFNSGAVNEDLLELVWMR